VEDATESITASDADPVKFDGFWERTQRRCSVQAAVGAVFVIALLVLTQNVEQVGAVPDQGAVQQLPAAAVDPALHDRVHPRSAERGRDHLSALGCEDRVERIDEFRVPVADQVLHAHCVAS
jgi:hypothetical protein